MKFYRVKQIGECSYIPQVKDGIFSLWKGIDTNFYRCYSNESYQKLFCSALTLEEAKEIITKYKSLITKKVKYPKYYRP